MPKSYTISEIFGIFFLCHVFIDLHLNFTLYEKIRPSSKSWNLSNWICRILFLKWLNIKIFSPTRQRIVCSVFQVQSQLVQCWCSAVEMAWFKKNLKKYWMWLIFSMSKKGSKSTETVTEKILRECHELYVDDENGLCDISKSMGKNLLAPR